MRRFIKHALHLNQLRKLVGWEMLGDAIKNQLNLETQDQPQSGRVLVLSPHPNDDVMGCGGVLSKHRDQGDEVKIIYFCDGRSGTRRRTTEIVREELKKTRRDEAITAARIIGISQDNLNFWNYRDNSLMVNKAAIKALTQIILEFMPQTIYAPHLLDNNSDHIETANILYKTIEAIGGNHPADIWSYEIWQPTFANRLVNIFDTLEQKRSAIDAHKSQLKCRPYTDAIIGLNTYRGAMMGMDGPAEAFLVLKPKLYLKLWGLLKDING